VRILLSSIYRKRGAIREQREKRSFLHLCGYSSARMQAACPESGSLVMRKDLLSPPYVSRGDALERTARAGDPMATRMHFRQEQPIRKELR
jgi:hypothetical protein